MHPAFREAVRIRQGIHEMPDPHALEHARAMIELTGDYDGEIAAALIWLYHAECNRLEAMTIAFLAGLLVGRDE